MFLFVYQAIVGTMLSYFINFKDTFDIQVVGDLPAG